MDFTKDYLSVRAEKILRSIGIRTMQELQQADIEVISKIKGAGRKTINEIERAKIEFSFEPETKPDLSQALQDCTAAINRLSEILIKLNLKIED